jgi:hypothetical protein
MNLPDFKSFAPEYPITIPARIMAIKREIGSSRPCSANQLHSTLGSELIATKHSQTMYRVAEPLTMSPLPTRDILVTTDTKTMMAVKTVRICLLGHVSVSPNSMIAAKSMLRPLEKNAVRR